MSVARKLTSGLAALAMAVGGSVAMAGAATAAPAQPTGQLDSASLGTDSLGLGSSFGSVGPLGMIDTQSLGIGKDAAGLEIVENDGQRMRVRVHNPEGFFGLCTPVMVEAGQAASLLVDPEALLKGGTGITTFNPINLQGTWNSIGYPAEGIHVLAVVCAGLGASDMSMTLVAIPGTTAGSLEGMFGLGSTIGSLGLQSVEGSIRGIS